VRLSSVAVTVLFFLLPIPLFADSYYPSRIDDAKAFYLTSDHFAVRGDGVADDSDAIQQAIDKVQETTNQGILFIPAGRYRLTKTIYIWPGIRLIGYGATRPVFYLGPHTSGFQQLPTYMVFFAGGRPKAVQENGGAKVEVPATPPDATPGTFYSAISNIDIEIGEGNEGAIGVRAHYAQHCFLEHMDFRIGSGLAGIRDGGNVARDLHFFGGRYGIWTIKPSPGWQFTILDASFDGQREAAIREHEAGLTLVRVQFKNVPTAVSIDDTYSDELWIKDARMENVPGPALVISNENNARTEINAENINCHNVQQFVSYRESGKGIAGKGEIYAVKTFSHGLHYSDIGSVPAIRDIYDAAILNSMPTPVISDIPDLPAFDTWANILDFGAKGDGVADDTQAIKSAIASKRTIYFPSGQYLVTDTILLKPDTVLIGLHPSVTRFLLADSTPAFQGIGDPKALLETPPNGTNIVTGIGLYTNGINPRAVAAMWMAGPDSLMNDVRILGGHGTITPGVPTQQTSSTLTQQIYNNTHTADSDLRRRWDGQYPSIWVTQGGGGTFVDIWTPSTFAQAGFYVSHTATSGRVYELSTEHHVRNEVLLDHVSNWQIYALQTEEERGESGFAVPLEIRNSSDITVANLHMYRVVSSFQPFPYAIKLIESRNIHFRNVHCYSNSKVPFDNAIFDETHHFELRQREFAWLDYSGQAPAAATKPHSALLAPAAKVEKLADGFFNISGGAVDSSGNLYFVDSHAQTIYRWSASQHRLSIIRDNPLDPVELAFDKAGNLLVVSSAGNGTVYSFKPDSPDDRIKQIVAEPAKPRPGLTPILPVDIWRSGNDFFNAESAVKPYQYVSPDGTTFIPASEAFVSGRLYYGARLNDELRAFGMAPAVAGRHFYVSNEEEEKTYSADVGTDGTFSNFKLFAERGGEALAVDKQSNVYLGAGQVFVYDKSGRLIDSINIPGRPLQLLFGGRDGKTLFILAHGALYSLQMAVSGR